MVLFLDASDSSGRIAIGLSDRNDDKQKQSVTSTPDNIYRLEPSMKQLSAWFMESMVHGNLESSISPSSAYKIEQLWLSSPVQATFQRRSELPFLPDLADVFLNRVYTLVEPLESLIILYCKVFWHKFSVVP